MATTITTRTPDTPARTHRDDLLLRGRQPRPSSTAGRRAATRGRHRVTHGAVGPSGVLQPRTARAGDRRAVARRSGPVAAPLHNGGARRRRARAQRGCVAVALLVILVAGLVVWTSSVAEAGADVAALPAAEAPVVVSVAPGQTIWELARIHAPDGVSVPAYAHAITSHNGVDARALAPWTRLELP